MEWSTLLYIVPVCVLHEPITVQYTVQGRPGIEEVDF